MPPAADALPPSPSFDHESNNNNNNPRLFLDPMLGLPLQIYVEVDVPDRDTLVALVKVLNLIPSIIIPIHCFIHFLFQNHGGIISGGYSSVPYILGQSSSVAPPPPPDSLGQLVDPTKESGQSLFLQYIGKKGKVVLDAKWVYKCVESGRLQTYQSNFANCKVNGTERYVPIILSLHIADASYRTPDDIRNAEETSVHHPPLPPIHIPSHEQSSLPTDRQAQEHLALQIQSQSSTSSSSLIHSASLLFNNGRASIPDPQNPPSNWGTNVRHMPYGANPPVHAWNDTFEQGTHQQAQPYDFQYRTEEQWPPPSSEFFPTQARSRYYIYADF